MLEKTLKRDEAAVMLVRLLGAEEEVRDKNYALPFTDVDSWANPYVGWLYENKLLYGVAPELYGAKEDITGQQYLIFMLRCLGYSDTGEVRDFTYDTVFDFAKELHLFKNETYLQNLQYPLWAFNRNDCTILTFRALQWQMKQSTMPLAQYLIEKGVFTLAEYTSVLLDMPVYFDTDEKGAITYYMDDIALSLLGTAEGNYETVGTWQFDTFFLAEDTEGVTWVLDNQTLDKKCLLTEKKMFLLDGALHQDKLYFGVDEAGGDHSYYVYDDKTAEVQMLTGPVQPYYYGGAKGLYHIVAGSEEGIVYYTLNFLTADVETLFSEKTTYFSSQPMENHTDEIILFLGFNFEDYTEYRIYKNGVLAVGLKTVNLMGSNPPQFIYDLDTPEYYLIIDGFHIIEADNYKMTVLYKGNAIDNIGGRIISAVKGNNGLFLLMGAAEDNTGREIVFLTNDGKHHTVLDETIMAPLNITALWAADENGNLSFSSKMAVGMGHYDVYSYTYHSSENRVVVDAYDPGRPDFETTSNMEKLLADHQQMLDALLEH